MRYIVCAYNATGELSSAQTEETMYLPQPNVTVTNVATGVQVAWDAVIGATSYKVYRSVYSGGKWSSYSAYKTTTDTTWINTSVSSGQKVRYTVYAYNGNYRSAEKDGVATVYLTQPSVKVTNTSTGAKVSWSKVTGATSYKIYKSTYRDGAWSKYSYYKASTGTSYTDTKVKSGDKVQYTVYAVNSGYLSAEKTGVATVYLSQPKVKVTNTSTGVKVTWGKVTGATTYKVYKSTYSNGKWSSYKAYKTTKTTSYTEKLKSGQKVRYTVYAYNGSYKSAEKTGVATVYLSQPKIKLSKASKGVKVSWGKVTGATTYKVYKSIYKNGKWSSYKAYKTTKSTSWTDTSIKKKQKVRYMVYAYNGSYRSADKTGISITR